jgi:hypothetical protein
MDIFSYLEMMICIRDKQCAPIVTPKLVQNDNKQQVHKDVLKKVFDKGHKTVFIFENELYLLRGLDDLSNNEIKTFIGTNNDWDIMILSEIDKPTIKLDEFSYIKKLQDNKTFNESYVYIASARFAQKMNDPNATIETYVYDRPFLKNLTVDHPSNKYVIGEITNISSLNQVEIKYRWSELA